MRAIISGSSEIFDTIDRLAEYLGLSRSTCLLLFANVGIKYVMVNYHAEEFKKSIEELIFNV